MDKDGDGAITPAELDDTVLFAKLDANRNRIIALAEVVAFRTKLNHQGAKAQRGR